jgi:beta-galactosidase GanA
MKKDRIKSALLSIIMMLLSNTLRADNVSSQFRILGGELSNSAATSVIDIEEVLPRMKTLGLNTALVPVYWEFLEPIEGQMDFTLVDRTIDVALQQGLKIVPLWFGAWKNSMSCYAPAWFKRDVKRFPRAMTAEGKQMEIASCFSDNVLQADLKAFSALMRHIKERDPQREVIIMIQIENEIGMLESARDHSPLAEKAYNKERWAER